MTDAVIFDSHAHYDDASFAADRDSLLRNCLQQNVGYIVNVGSNLRSLTWVPYLCETYEHVYGAVGIHPDDTRFLNEVYFQRMRSLCEREKIVAVGEIGLDYYWNASPKEVQKHWFARQMELAAEQHLPVIIHSREAAQDTFDMIMAADLPCRGVIHCYSGSVEMALDYVHKGFLIGIGGVLTFKNGRKLKEVAAAVPLESILLETDCPYLAPAPFRGKRNASGLIRYVAEELARIKQCSYETVLECTCRNAKRLFRIA